MCIFLPITMLCSIGIHFYNAMTEIVLPLLVNCLSEMARDFINFFCWWCDRNLFLFWSIYINLRCLDWKKLLLRSRSLISSFIQSLLLKRKKAKLQYTERFPIKMDFSKFHLTLNLLLIYGTSVSRNTQTTRL